MDKVSEIKRLWRERFNDSRNWMTNVFPRIYRDEEAMIIPGDDGKSIISMLLLRSYEMRYRDQVMPVGFIFGAATSRGYQGKGFMTRLVGESLHAAYSRGDIAVTLKPPRRRLYGFFDRFGFATTFFIREQRYTARHRFSDNQQQYIVDSSAHDPAELAAAYRKLTSSREATMLHSADDFKTILIDSDLDNGCVMTARSVTTGAVEAIALAEMVYDTIAVREIAYADADAADAVLEAISRRYPDKMTVVEAYPDPESRARVFARGMARIVNVKAFLEMTAKAHPTLTQTLRVRDRLIEANDGVFRINKGNVEVLPYDDASVKLNLDVDVKVLTSIAFSTERMGEVFSLPTARPFMSMMLC